MGVCWRYFVAWRFGEHNHSTVRLTSTPLAACSWHSIVSIAGRLDLHVHKLLDSSASTLRVTKASTVSMKQPHGWQVVLRAEALVLPCRCPSHTHSSALASSLQCQCFVLIAGFEP